MDVPQALIARPKSVLPHLPGQQERVLPARLSSCVYDQTNGWALADDVLGRVEGVYDEPTPEQLHSARYATEATFSAGNGDITLDVYPRTVSTSVEQLAVLRLGDRSHLVLCKNLWSVLGFLALVKPLLGEDVEAPAAVAKKRKKSV